MTLEPASADNIRSIRAQAYAIFKKKKIRVAAEDQQPSRLNRLFPGVTIDEYRTPRPVVVINRGGDFLRTQRRHIARAVAALRAAGWVVDDDGTIREVPAKEKR